MEFGPLMTQKDACMDFASFEFLIHKWWLSSVFSLFSSFILWWFFFYGKVLEIEPKSLLVLNKHSITEMYPHDFNILFWGVCVWDVYLCCPWGYQIPLELELQVVVS